MTHKSLSSARAQKFSTTREQIKSDDTDKGGTHMRSRWSSSWPRRVSSAPKGQWSNSPYLQTTEYLNRCRKCIWQNSTFTRVKRRKKKPSKLGIQKNFLNKKRVHEHHPSWWKGERWARDQEQGKDVCCRHTYWTLLQGKKINPKPKIWRRTQQCLYLQKTCWSTQKNPKESTKNTFQKKWVLQCCKIRQYMYLKNLLHQQRAIGNV